MSIESEQQKNILDNMEAERRLKLGRDLAKNISPFILLEMVLLFSLWLWNLHYVQIFLLVVLLVPAVVLLMLQKQFESKRLSILWASLFSVYLVFITTAISFFIPEALFGSLASYAIVFLMVGLLSGIRSLVVAACFSALGFFLNVLAGNHLSDILFPRLYETVSLIVSISLGVFAILTTGIIFYLVLSGQEKLYRQAQLAKIESEQAKSIAENANRAKSTFLASTSHELRTPLNAILGFSQIMARDTTLLNSTHRESIKIINRNGEHLLGLINNVLDMAKIESGHILLQERHFDLYQLIESIGTMFRMRANSKGLSLTVEYASDVPAYVQMDDGKLRQVLINLLGNAVKFTTTGVLFCASASLQ